MAYETTAQPGDFTQLYNTVLSPSEEAQFQGFLQANPERARDLYDYDLRGAWLNGAKAAANGHLPDTYKKPNHPTFSTESQYSGQDATGGVWRQLPSGKWEFDASPDNLRYRDENALRSYFNQVEPGNTLVMPSVNALTTRSQ